MTEMIDRIYTAKIAKTLKEDPVLMFGKSYKLEIIDNPDEPITVKAYYPHGNNNYAASFEYESENDMNADWIPMVKWLDPIQVVFHMKDGHDIIRRIPRRDVCYIGRMMKQGTTFSVRIYNEEEGITTEIFNNDAIARIEIAMDIQ